MRERVTELNKACFYFCFIYENITLLIVYLWHIWGDFVVCVFRAVIKLLPCLPGTTVSGLV